MRLQMENLLKKYETYSEICANAMMRGKRVFTENRV